MTMVGRTEAARGKIGTQEATASKVFGVQVFYPFQYRAQIYLPVLHQQLAALIHKPKNTTIPF